MALQVKDYRRQGSPSSGPTGLGRQSLGRLQEHGEGEHVEQQRKPYAAGQLVDGQRQAGFIVPRPRSRTQRVMSDETNLPPTSRVPCKQNVLEPALCPTSRRLPCQVRGSYGFQSHSRPISIQCSRYFRGIQLSENSCGCQW